MNNNQIKELMRTNHIYMWQVAKWIGVHETVFCKWFRDNLTQEQTQQILSAIEKIKSERQEGKEYAKN